MNPEKITLGITAHVDAGKTTLSEAMLYEGGVLRQLGRVDNGDTALDTDEVERERGITIYSREARISRTDREYIFIDTPGHVDFSAETERSFSMLDYAILVISGLDGVQSHTRTLWKLLDQYRIPVLIFVNKMDISRHTTEELMDDIRRELSDDCIDWASHTDEDLAVCGEELLEEYTQKGRVSEEAVRDAFADRKFFPCLFGSALKLTGIDELFDALDSLTKEKKYGDEFGARVYKVTRDKNGARLVHLKVTGGTLKNRDTVTTVISSDSGQSETEASDQDNVFTDKVSDIRLYNGDKYESVTEVASGEVAAVAGLDHVKIGDGLGFEAGNISGVLEPVLSYRVIPPTDVSIYTLLEKIRMIEEEDPKLSVEWLEETREIHVRLMGPVQIEVLKESLKRRFSINVTFDAGKIMYKETISNAVEGIGHFEPLRHYAEVHLLLEPGEPGSGIQVENEAKTDVLAINWQNLILTHIKERVHRGVLTGSPLTDVKITLINGRASTVHTVGGDFRQATYRAIRQGLKKADSVLLEPYYNVTLNVPQDMVGRAMTDLNDMYGRVDSPVIEDHQAVITGRVPVSCVADYAREVYAYTKGQGSITFDQAGYFPCHNTAEVIAEKGYDSETDLRNPTSSVFCGHGAGYQVPWFMVDGAAHVESALRGTGRIDEEGSDAKIKAAADALEQEEEAYRAQMEGYSSSKGSSSANRTGGRGSSDKSSYQGYTGMSAELEEIFVREFGPIKSPFADSYSETVRDYNSEEEKKKAREEYFSTHAPAAEKRRNQNKKKRYLLIDGYNVIHAWKELSDLVAVDLNAARTRLLDIVSNYQGYDGAETIVVFDAYRIKGNPGISSKYHNIYVVYTREAQTADAYIERATHELVKDAFVSVVTSDGAEQVIVAGSGAVRISSREFEQDVKSVTENGLSDYKSRNNLL